MLKKIIGKEKDIVRLIKRYFVLSMTIFIVSFCLGVLFTSYQQETAQRALETIKEEFSFIEKLNNIQLGLFIFLNNSIKIFLFIFLGVIFTIPTLFFLITNGFVLGFVITAVYPDLGFKETFNSLFYHGVFELLALFIGSSLGIWIGTIAIKKIKKTKKLEEILKIKEIKTAFSFSFKIFLLIIVPLLAAAAIIETLLIINK